MEVMTRKQRREHTIQARKTLRLAMKEKVVDDAIKEAFIKGYHKGIEEATHDRKESTQVTETNEDPRSGQPAEGDHGDRSDSDTGC